MNPAHSADIRDRNLDLSHTLSKNKLTRPIRRIVINHRTVHRLVLTSRLVEPIRLGARGETDISNRPALTVD
jgi:hypothetical protein